MQSILFVLTKYFCQKNMFSDDCAMIDESRGKTVLSTSTINYMNLLYGDFFSLIGS